MSYEGSIQLWCPKGHYWTTGDLIYAEEEARKKGYTCPECGEMAFIGNEVDETNCDNWGWIEPIQISDNIYKFPRVLGCMNCNREHLLGRNLQSDPRETGCFACKCLEFYEIEQNQ